MGLDALLTSILLPLAIAYVLYNERDKRQVRQEIKKLYTELVKLQIEIKVLAQRDKGIEVALARFEEKFERLIDRELNRKI